MNSTFDDRDRNRVFGDTLRLATSSGSGDAGTEPMLDEEGLFVPSQDLRVQSERLKQFQWPMELNRLGGDQEDPAAPGGNAQRTGPQHQIDPPEIAEREIDAVVDVQEDVEVV